MAANQQTLTRYLSRFQGRVEMSLKVKLAAQLDGTPQTLPFSLAGLSVPWRRARGPLGAIEGHPDGAALRGLLPDFPAGH